MNAEMIPCEAKMHRRNDVNNYITFRGNKTIKNSHRKETAIRECMGKQRGPGAKAVETCDPKFDENRCVHKRLKALWMGSVSL